MGMLKLIECKNEDRDAIVTRFDIKNDYITRGSKLTVREGQAAVFCHKGKMADVFLPGFYTLETDNVPLLTKLMSWKYGFESPFKSDIYFVNTRQFTNQKWGTSNPFIIRDADYGAVRVRAFGTYAFKVDDPYVFLTELAGTNTSFMTTDITHYLRSMLVTRISDIVGESKIPVLDMAGNLVELGEMVEQQLESDFKNMGLQLVQFNFENFSLPEALEKALDESASLGILGKNMNVYMQKAQADALKDAAKNPGMAGATMGAGMGLGMGAAFGNMMSNMNVPNMNANNANGAANVASSSATTTCPSCGATINAKAKFCPECGAMNGVKCAKCGHIVVSKGAKFCPECGATLGSVCPKCGANLKPSNKFCPECGERIN